MEAQIKQLMEMHSEQKKAVGRINQGMKLIDTIQASLERWKLIDGHPNYGVSTNGRVRNDDTGKLLKGWINKRGYHIIDLSDGGTRQHFFTHRLVALAFIDNPFNKLGVYHKNCDKLNNNITNLRWATQSENMMNKSM
jgi:hypothetical protein